MAQHLSIPRVAGLGCLDAQGSQVYASGLDLDVGRLRWNRRERRAACLRCVVTATESGPVLVTRML